ncbi:amidohydrolase [Paracoccus sp. TK19116]|uniref:Amidohydrolase n=1 Tax=Paracoccus albicereus TaxID=2922394 RepID=A0ABT1MPC9_9RHOB|nr:amidohydrolase [Paracoccus albicereus]MCQ0969969.1 amidohydrolase [Paracoccus albicereus]
MIDRPTNEPRLFDALKSLRRELHRFPELSGQEVETARRVVGWLGTCHPDSVITGFGGHGVAAIFDGEDPGPTVMLRAELDALPIIETGQPDHRSLIDGKAHLCGHDGHTAILCGLAAMLGEERPAKGRVVLLFQPAEEDGSGAAAVIDDPRYLEIAPDFAFSIHNMPGVPLGHARIAPGAMNCASRGLRIGLQGRTAHASMPETGLSPAPALAALIPALTALSRGADVADAEFRLATITHAHLGAPAFGIAPGDAELWVTLRSRDDSGMDGLLIDAQAAIARHARELTVSLSQHDIFLACSNDDEATQIFRKAFEAEGIVHDSSDLPMRASEDFGRFGLAGTRSAMALLGSGEIPALHNPDYDFPDALIPVGMRLFRRLVSDILG